MSKRTSEKAAQKAKWVKADKLSAKTKKSPCKGCNEPCVNHDRPCVHKL